MKYDEKKWKKIRKKIEVLTSRNFTLMIGQIIDRISYTNTYAGNALKQENDTIFLPLSVLEVDE